MYTPALLKEERLEVLHSLIAKNPFGAIVTCTSNGPSADHIPLVLHSDLSANGTLRGHVAKNNPLAEYSNSAVDTLVIFQGPHTYITPSWYPSKAEHGKVVPTWNYVLVHAYGKLVLNHDKDWLMQHLESLTLLHEANREIPWKPKDAPEKYLSQQLSGIVGVELIIDRFQGKWKISQNKGATDKLGVVEGLRSEATEHAIAMADLVGSHT